MKSTTFLSKTRIVATAVLLAVSAVALTPQTSTAREGGLFRFKPAKPKPLPPPPPAPPPSHHHHSHTTYHPYGAAIQRALRSRGYYRGPADGSIGPMTRRAIAAYKADRRIHPANSDITNELLRSLRLKK